MLDQVSASGLVGTSYCKKVESRSELSLEQYDRYWRLRRLRGTAIVCVVTSVAAA